MTSRAPPTASSSHQVASLAATPNGSKRQELLPGNGRRFDVEEIFGDSSRVCRRIVGTGDADIRGIVSDRDGGRDETALCSVAIGGVGST